MDTRRGLIALAIVGFTTSATAVGSWSLNFGLFRDNQLRAHSQQLFGVGKPLEASSTEDIGAFSPRQIPGSWSHSQGDCASMCSAPRRASGPTST